MNNSLTFLNTLKLTMMTVTKCDCVTVVLFTNLIFQFMLRNLVLMGGMAVITSLC